MNIKGVLPLALLLLGVFTQCTNRKEDKPKVTAVEPNTADSSAIKLDSLLVSLNESAILCAEVSKVASRSTNPDIRTVAENLVNLNSAILKEIQELSDLKRVQLPDSLPSDKMKRINAINKKTGAEFDKRIIRMMESEQRKLFSTMRQTRNLKDSELDAFAKRNREIIIKATQDIRNLRTKVTPERSNAEDERPA